MPNVVVRRPPFRKRGQAWLPLSDPVARSITGKGGVVIGGTADATFTHRNVDADVVIEWDLDNDGDFEGGVEDVTTYVMSLETLTGRDWASNLTGRAQPGQLRMTLYNGDDRFSFFNTDSPLNQGDYSLRTGRRLRVRTSDAVVDDPVLLARDRFDRSDGALGDAETGQPWVNQLNSGFAIEDGAAVMNGGASSQNTVATLSLGPGFTDHYVQATAVLVEADLTGGVVARFDGTANYIRAYYNPGNQEIVLAETVAGSPVLVDTYDVVGWRGMTLGLGVVGEDVTVYLAGVPVITATTTLLDGYGVGLYGFTTSATVRSPRIDDFAVWDHVTPTVEGILWTGEVSEINPSLDVAGIKTVVVSGEGILSRAALADVNGPRVPESGNPTGVLAADVMARAGLLMPPQSGELDEGTITMGPVGVSDGKAFEIARLFEETEQGFLHETNEGTVGFHDADHRAAFGSVVTFSDSANTQFGYATLEPFDHRREIVNQVTAGVAPSEPEGITLTTYTDSANFGVQNHTEITLPATINAGDLLVVFLRRSNQTSGVNWLTPIWWDSYRNEELDAIWTRVYSHHCDGTEDSDVVRFYTDSASAGGPWVAHLYHIEGWYLDSHGIQMAPFVSGENPGALLHDWGLASALYIACYSGTHLAGGGSVVGTTYPNGYGNGSTSVFTTPGDVFLSTARKLDCVEVEDPSAFDGDSDFALVEATVIGIRGYNGDHVEQGTLKNPTRFVPSPGRFVTVNDTESQDRHNALRSHVNPSNLFASEADAETYADGVIDTYSDDRPILSITFYATTSNAYRAQAIRRRVSDRITLMADGVAGYGANQDFFIESIGHRITDGGTLWATTWTLSPA